LRKESDEQRVPKEARLLRLAFGVIDQKRNLLKREKRNRQRQDAEWQDMKGIEFPFLFPP